MENHEKKQYTAEQKVAILRRHLIEKVTVPDLCDEYHLHPTVFYRWLKQFFENGAAAFGPPPRTSKEVEAREARIRFLEAKLKRKDEVMAELMEEHVALKKVLGRFERPMGTARHTRPSHRFCAPLEHGVRNCGAELCSLAGASDEQVLQLARALRANEHHGWVRRDFWLEAWEKQAIIEFHDQHPLEGYRRMTFMMLDQDIVAVSPASVWRVLHTAGRLLRWNRKASSKGQGFQPPLRPREHWHVDISYVNLAGTFYDLCRVLDGSSRY